VTAEAVRRAFRREWNSTRAYRRGSACKHHRSDEAITRRPAYPGGLQQFAV